MLRPLFRRPDGDLITTESNVRNMIPFLMLGRNESVVMHDELIDLTRTKPWLRDYNKAHPGAQVTLFHLILAAIGRGLHARPGMNRFVSGGRLYQRKGVQLSFAAKKQFKDSEPLVTIKMPFASDEDLAVTAGRVQEAIGAGRSGVVSTVDQELALAMMLPAPVLSVVMSILRTLDRWNLLPGAMIEPDPMYASCFVANLGSVGIDKTYHHLYEYGTASLFCVIGQPRKHIFIGRDEKIVVKDAVETRWTFDERINDGFYCAASLKYFAGIIEQPEKHFGVPALADLSTAGTGPA